MLELFVLKYVRMHRHNLLKKIVKIGPELVVCMFFLDKKVDNLQSKF